MLPVGRFTDLDGKGPAVIHGAGGDTRRVSPQTGSVRPVSGGSLRRACGERIRGPMARFPVGCSPYPGGEQPFTLGAASELCRRLYGQSAARHSAGVWSARSQLDGSVNNQPAAGALRVVRRRATIAYSPSN